MWERAPRMSNLLTRTGPLLRASLASPRRAVPHHLHPDRGKPRQSTIGRALTPCQAEAIAKYSHVFRRPQGACFLSLTNIDTLEEDLKSHFVDSRGRKREYDLVVVSDGEAILVSTWLLAMIGMADASGHRRPRSGFPPGDSC